MLVKTIRIENKYNPHTGRHNPSSSQYAYNPAEVVSAENFWSDWSSGWAVATKVTFKNGEVVVLACSVKDVVLAANREVEDDGQE